MTTVQEILRNKGTDVVSIDASESVQAAARLMNERKIGGLVVTAEGTMVGIVTERDVMRRVVAEPRDSAATTVGEIMTSPVATCRPDTPLKECIGVMTRDRVRHLPVVDHEGVCGIITQGDILAFQLTEHEATIRYLSAHSWDVGGEG